MIIGTGDRDSLRVFIESLLYMHNMVKTWENRGVDFEKGNEVAYKCRKKKVRKNFEIRTIDFCPTKCIMELCPTIKRGDGMSPRTGRPTDNPRPNKLSIRISDEDKLILEKYCETEGVNRTEAISRGIKKLESEIKK